MYSNVTLYYLNQIGITPLVTKDNSLNLLSKSNTAESNTLKLIVLISSDFSNKAKSLFNRMMTYINLQENELLLINIKQYDLAQNTNKLWFSQIENKTPLAILALGPNTKDLFNDSNPSYSIVQSLALDYLLTNPLNKKKVFQDLSYLKQLMSQGY